MLKRILVVEDEVIIAAAISGPFKLPLKKPTGAFDFSS